MNGGSVISKYEVAHKVHAGDGRGNQPRLLISLVEEIKDMLAEIVEISARGAVQVLSLPVAITRLEWRLSHALVG